MITTDVEVFREYTNMKYDYDEQIKRLKANVKKLKREIKQRDAWLEDWIAENHKIAKQRDELKKELHKCHVKLIHL